MSALLLTILGQVWPFILGALGILGLGAYQRRQGRLAERAKQAEAEKKARDISDDVDNDIGAMTPEQRREALRKWMR